MNIWFLSIIAPLCLIDSAVALTSPVSQWKNDIRVGYERRIAADPNFAKKSVLEVVLAAGTQLSAEMTQRGPQRLLPELDFLVAGVLTAVIGKYYSMWRVAKTQVKQSAVTSSPHREPSLWGVAVPTNAFQETMLDGITRPTLAQRTGSIILPVPSLFQAGIVASTLGYGLTAVAIALRSVLLPQYVAATRQVNIVYAAVYTGVFMAVVSNLRYQLLQGLVEPALEKILRSFPAVCNAFLVVVRIGNGWLGSVLAIAGMKWLGLQRLK